MIRRLLIVLLSTTMVAACSGVVAGLRARTEIGHSTSDVPQSRVAQCRQVAEELSQQKPQLSTSAAMAESPFTYASAQEVAKKAQKRLLARQKLLKCGTLPALADTQPPNVPNVPNSSGHLKRIGSTVVSPPSRPGRPRSVFHRCFKRCRSYTDRTKGKCFDVCNASCSK